MLLLFSVGQILNVFLQKLSKLSRKLLSISFVDKIYVTVEVINYKLMIVTVKEQTGFRARVLVQKFLHALK